MAERVAIAGGSGFIGRELQQVLEGAGYQVSIVTRKAKRPEDIEWSPSNATIPKDAFEGFSAVINLAGENIAEGFWTKAKRQRIQDSRIKSTELISQHLAEMPAETRPKKLINASAIGFYGNRGDEELVENSSPGDSFLAKTCIAWEEATSAAEAAGVSVTHGRIGVVFDPAEAAFAHLLPVFKYGFGGRVGSGKQFWSWISREDLASALHFLIDADLQGPVNLVSPNPIQFSELAKKLAQALRRPNFVWVPGPFIKLLGGEKAFELALASTRVLPERLTNAGFQFRHPDFESFLSEKIPG